MSLDEAGQLKQAIDRNDIERVKTMMTRNPALHRAPLGYGKDGPLSGFAMAQFLVERGADLGLRVKLPGHYERPNEVVECTPLGYARRFQTDSHSDQTVAFLRERGPSDDSITPE